MAKMPSTPQAWNDQPAGATPWQFAQATSPAPANTTPALPAGVDWDFVNEREGVLTQGYVPEDRDAVPMPTVA